MIFFPIVIVLSLVLYIFFKVRILSVKDELTMRYTNAKARICLGILLFFFGINQYLFYETRLSLFIGIIFVFFGFIQAQYGFKLFKYFRKEILRKAEATG
ncbi:YtpI-like protein [Salinibacillus kushneri]|uniref:YtpI-like protein n=1 Tax=Salinibacillus kushneri TaxID=237682 RepID=A0A1I0H7A2_9BACI|nr:YtpI family protein [Salinibacillus kushneri]SET79583.1 YtpI-like protein [Salinibacillus kushneri]